MKTEGEGVMYETSNENLTCMAADCRKLIASKMTLLLSTASTESVPEISYAPYVQDRAGDFYIYVSELAAHTANLITNRQASILFIHPESESANLFARERAVLTAALVSWPVMMKITQYSCRHCRKNLVKSLAYFVHCLIFTYLH